MLRHSFNRTKGFTVVELVVVIVVIAVLATITVISYNAIARNSTKKAVESDLQGLSAQIKADKIKNGSYMMVLPSTIRYQNQDHTVIYQSTGDTFCVSLTSIKDSSIVFNTTQEGSIQEGACAIVARQIAAGYRHTLILGTNGKVYAVGNNSSGQLGDGTAFTTRTSPVSAQTGSLVGKTVTQIAAGSDTSYAIASDGTLHAWGFNSSYQLGDGTNTTRRSPVLINSGSLAGKTIVAISAGNIHALALASDGTLHSWGSSGYGQVGYNSTTTRQTPIAINSYGTLNGKTISKIFTSASNSFALATDNTLHAWGANYRGQIGNGSTGQANVAVNITNNGSLNGKVISSIASGSGTHVLAVATDGTLHGWGRNANGQLGNGLTATYLTSPINILVSSAPTSIAIGEEFSMMRTANGNIYTWGLGSGNQLGNNSTSSSNVPILINSFGALNGNATASVAAGAQHGVVLGTNGRLYTWGTNALGPLGDGSTTLRTVPVVANPLPQT